MPVVVSRELKRVKGSHMCAAPSQAFVTYANTKKTRTHTHWHWMFMPADAWGNCPCNILQQCAIDRIDRQCTEHLPTSKWARMSAHRKPTAFDMLCIVSNHGFAVPQSPTGTSRPYRRNKHPQHHQTYSPLRISQFLTHCSFTTPFSFSLYLPSFRPLPLGFQFLVLYSFVPCRGGRSRSKWSRFHQGRRWSCWCCCDWRWSRRRQTWGGADVIWD